MSLAYLGAFIFSGRYSFISDINRINNVGPTTVPYITTASTFFHSVLCSCVITLCFRFCKYAAIHETIHLEIFIFVSFSSSIMWSTRSNAFEKSKIVGSRCTICFQFFNFFFLLFSVILCVKFWLLLLLFLFLSLCFSFLPMNSDISSCFFLPKL